MGVVTRLDRLFAHVRFYDRAIHKMKNTILLPYWKIYRVPKNDLSLFLLKTQGNV